MSTIGSSVVKVLEDNGYLQESYELKEALEEVDSEDFEIKNRSINKIEGLCSMRSFGDLHITTMNGWAWNTLLGKLKKKILSKKRKGLKPN